MPSHGLSVIRGARMLHFPPIDKIAARTILERHLGHQVPIVGFEDRSVIPDEEWNAWRRDGIVPIDLGTWKYHGHAGSATEFTARQFNLHPSSGEAILIKLLAENNKSGALKKGFGSIAWLLRDLYELGYDPHAVITQVSGVIETWLSVYDEHIESRDAEQAWAVLPRFKEFKQGRDKPFTIGNYLENLWRLQASQDYAESELDWWLTAYQAVRDAQEAGVRLLRTASRLHEFTAGDISSAALVTDNKFVTRAATKQYPCVIVMHPDGHAAVMARGHDLGTLSNRLAVLEPRLWKAQRGESAMLVNGGLIYKGVPPTKLELMELVELLKEHPPKKL